MPSRLQPRNDKNSKEVNHPILRRIMMFRLNPPMLKCFKFFQLYKSTNIIKNKNKKIEATQKPNIHQYSTIFIQAKLDDNPNVKYYC